MTIFEFFQKNNWGFIGVVLAFVVFIINSRSKRKEENKDIFNNKFNYSHEKNLKRLPLCDRLFNESGAYNNVSRKMDMPNTGKFNVPNIIRISRSLVEFKDNKNKFRTRKANILFNKTYIEAKKIAVLTNSKSYYDLGILTDPNNTNYDLFNKNKQIFDPFKETFEKFYRYIFENI